MIIDFHAHIFPDKLAPKVIPKLEKASRTTAFIDGTFVGLQESMKQSGVQLSITLPVASAASQVVSCNNFAYQNNEQYGNRIFSFGAMHPDFEDYRTELTRIRDMGLKGIKLHPDYQQTKFDDIRYKRIIDVASSLGLIVLTHAGLDIGLPDPIHATPQSILNVVQEVQPEKLVLAHMGGFSLWEDVLEKLGGYNVYLDTSFSLGEIHYFENLSEEERTLSMMSPTLFIRMIQTFGEDRLLFATDSPWGGQSQTLATFQSLPLNQEQQEKILWKNASDLLQLG